MVFVDVVLIAVAVGLLLGGRLGALAVLPFRGTWLAFAALALQTAAFPLGSFPWHTPTDVARALWLASYVLLAALLVRNRSITGAPVVAFGLTSNVVAIIANGGLMPVRASALAAEGRSYHVHQNSIQSLHPRLGWLVDRWAVPHWLPLGNVYSLGDVLIAAGIAIVIVTAMRADRQALADVGAATG